MSTKTLRFRLGDKVRMTGTVEKVRTERPNDFGRTTPCVAYPDVGLPEKNPSAMKPALAEHGVIVGRRTIQPGRVHYGSWDDPTEFIADPGQAESVWLVAFDLRRKPVMCRDNQLTEENDS